MIRWEPANWPTTDNVKALTTFRNGGRSRGGYATLNLSSYVSDDPEAVAFNRQLLREELSLPSEPCWLWQQHTGNVLNLDTLDDLSATATIAADASYTQRAGVVCAVLTADCVPILIKTEKAHLIGAIHAGWRGIVNGIIENTIKQLPADAPNICAWIGPAIGARGFVVGREVYEQFVLCSPDFRTGFKEEANGKYCCDLVGIVKQCLRSAGVTRIYCAFDCDTYERDDKFYSYRRDGAQTGRMASLIWMRD